MERMKKYILRGKTPSLSSDSSSQLLKGMETLSSLQDKYEQLSYEHESLILKHHNVGKDMASLQAKYDKLKEAFNSLLQSSVSTKFKDSYGLNAVVGMEKYKERWLNKAGL